MASAAKVRVLEDGLVVNDPDHRAIKCELNAVVLVAGGWYADSLVASGLVERVGSDAPAHLLQSLAESEALLAALTPQDFTTPSGGPNPSAQEPDLSDLSEPELNVPVKAPETAQDEAKDAQSGKTGGQLPGRVSEVEAVQRKRAGSKAK